MVSGGLCGRVRSGCIRIISRVLICGRFGIVKEGVFPWAAGLPQIATKNILKNLEEELSGAYRASRRIRSRRTDTAHKATTEITRDRPTDHIITEADNAQQWAKNRRLSKSTSGGPTLRVNENLLLTRLQLEMGRHATVRQGFHLPEMRSLPPPRYQRRLQLPKIHNEASSASHRRECKSIEQCQLRRTKQAAVAA